MKEKIKSNKGATLLIAIVFMLFCVFVGGSVLAAATANGSRVEQAMDDEQAYLSQRSAALIAAEELRSEDSVKIRFLSEGQTVGFEYLDNSNRPTTQPTTLRQLAYLCAANAYILNNPELAAYSIDSRSLDKLINPNTLVRQDGTGCYADFSLRLATGEGTWETLQARMYCDMYYNITVVFPGESGADGKLHLEMNKAASLTSEEVGAEAGGEAGEEAPEEFWIQLYWKTPKVVKGGDKA